MAPDPGVPFEQGLTGQGLTGVVAAGTVLWRPSPDPTSGTNHGQIALVHRPKYDDWSLPKGKCEPGENPCVTAVRETLEETGFSGPITRNLGLVEYEVAGPDGRPIPKVVHYWAMPALVGAFTPSTEVDELRWLEPMQALRVLTREADQLPVREFLARPADTTTAVLIRHADAGDRRSWNGPDTLRPLNEHGHWQAANIAAVGACFGLSAVVAADVTRCVATVTPLAAQLGLSLEKDPVFAEDYPGQSPGLSVARIRELVAGGNVAICSQGGIIPEALELLRHEDHVSLVPRARKGSLWLLSFAGAGLVAAQYLPDAAPIS